MSRSKTSAGGAQFRIHAVAKATGVPAGSIRVWERRYGELASRRSPSGYRLFTEADVERIALIKRRLDAGHAISTVMALSLDELRRLDRDARATDARPPTGNVAELTRARFMDAIATLDLLAADRAIAAAALVLSPIELATTVVAPILEEIGARWAAGALSVAQEHAATAVVRGHLGDLLRTARRDPEGRLIVASTPAGELHELGALLASIVAAAHGHRVLYLGASLPIEALASATRSAQADTVLLSCVAGSSRETAAMLRETRAALPTHVALIVGGAGITTMPPRGVTWVRSLDALPIALTKKKRRGDGGDEG